MESLKYWAQDFKRFRARPTSAGFDLTFCLHIEHQFIMRGKRSKQYGGFMQQCGLSFGFREPYQVLSEQFNTVFSPGSVSNL